MKIRCGGFKSPFDPFVRANGSRICNPETRDLTLWANKLAPKQQDKWLATAAWTDEDGNRHGAMSWKDGSRGDVYWDNQPLSYDPRLPGERESWGEHRPRYGGNGWWSGAVFSDARDVNINNPADISATSYQLPPGVTIVPQLNVPFYGGWLWRPEYWPYRFNGDGSATEPFYDPATLYGQMNWSPISGYTAIAAYCWGPRAVGQIYRFNNSYVVNSAWPNITLVIPQYVIGSTFGYSIFYPNTLPANIPNTHEAAAPPARAPQAGDMVATFLGRSITYQEAQGGAVVVNDYDGYPEYADIPPIPAGTLVTYTWSQAGVERVAPITSRNNAIDGFGQSFSSLGFADDGINDRYGVSVEGTTGAQEINRSGSCYIFEWWRDQYVLHQGTYSIKSKTRQEGGEDRPPGSTGPSSGSNGWPQWPSKRNECDRFVSSLLPYSINIPPGNSYLKEFTTNVTLTWSGFGGNGGSRAIEYKTLEWAAAEGLNESGVYDPAKGGPPRVTRVWRPTPVSYHMYYPYKVGGFGGFVSDGFDVIAVGTVERNSSGTRIGGCWSETAYSYNPATGGEVSFGVNTGGNVFSDGSPASCSIIGNYFHGGLVASTINTPFLERVPGTAPPETPPNCSLTDPRSGSSLPGYPTGDPEFPPLPPGGLGNSANSKSFTETEIEYEIQAPIGRGLTARSYYYELSSSSKGGTATWNGNISSSSYTPEQAVETTLEFADPVTLIRDDLAGYEEVLYAYLEFDRKTGSFLPTNPPPPDRTTVYYRRAGFPPVEVNAAIKDEFPEAAWFDPRSWNWTQWLGLKDGYLYLYRSDSETLNSYKTKTSKVRADRYLVSDGSFSAQGTKSFEALSLASGNAVIYDHHAFG